MFVLVCSVKGESVSDPPTWWPHDHGPTNDGAMVEIYFYVIIFRKGGRVATKIAIQFWFPMDAKIHQKSLKFQIKCIQTPKVLFI